MESALQSLGEPRSQTAMGLLKTLALIGVTWLVYWPSLQNGFIWDDKLHLLDNIVLKPNGLFRVWFTTDYINYWPLTWTSYWLEHQYWGLNPTGYHVTNLVLHTIGSLLIWRVLCALKIPAAWFAAVVFAIHPVNVESVAWIAQRKNVLCLVFYVMSVLAYLRFDEQNRTGMYLLALVSFLLAMLSKGAAAPLPVVVLLCIWWRHGTLSRRDVWRTLPFFAVAGVMSLVEIWFQYVRSIGNVVVRDDSLLARLTGVGWCCWFYLSKAVFPFNLSFVYPRWTIDPANPISHLPNLALVALLVIAWKYRHAWGRPLLFALTCYFVTLSPILGFFNIFFMRYSFVADHYQYLAIIAPIALIAGVAWTQLQSRGVPLKTAGYVLAIVITACLGFLSRQQMPIYENQVTLWRDTLQKNPQAWLAHYNLANILSEQQQWTAAEEHYREALRINDDDAWAHHNLAIVLERQGDPDEAAREYERSFEIDPTLADAQYNLGNLRMAQGRWNDAVDHFLRALQVNPGLATAENNLAAALERQGKGEQAIVHYRRALQIAPTNEIAHRNLGQLLLERGERAQGELHLREALRLQRQRTLLPTAE